MKATEFAGKPSEDFAYCYGSKPTLVLLVEGCERGATEPRSQKEMPFPRN